MMNATRYLPFAGRLLIGLPFAISGLSKLAAYSATTETIRAAGLPAVSLAFAVAVAIELGGGVSRHSSVHVRLALGGPLAFGCERMDEPVARRERLQIPWHSLGSTKPSFVACALSTLLQSWTGRPTSSRR
jgi:hypothetical protein